MLLPAKLQETINNLSAFHSREERMQALVDIASRFQEPPEEVLLRPSAVAGDEILSCEGGVRVYAVYRNDRVYYFFSVANPEAIAAKALAVILQEGLSGLRPETISTVPDDLAVQIFGREFAREKNLGLANLVRQVKTLALRTG